MSAVLILPARLRHVHLIASRMRAADKAEIWASGDFRPAQALRRSLRGSELARTAFIGGEAAAMFGVMVAGPWAIPWLLTTDTVDRYPLSFWRASKIVLAELRQLYPLMIQQVDARYAQALSWLGRLGFDVARPEPFGVKGLPFHRITLGATHV